MSDLDDLLREARPDPKRIMRVVAQLAAVVERHEQKLDRLDIVDDLPANAVLGAMLRLRGDQTGAVYLGNGPNRPLSKLVPVPT